MQKKVEQDSLILFKTTERTVHAPVIHNEEYGENNNGVMETESNIELRNDELEERENYA